MTHRRSRLLLPAILGFCVLAGAGSAQDGGDAAPREIEARLTRVEGAVYLHPHDADPDQFVEADADAPVEDGDMVRTGSDGSADVSLDGQSVIEIAPNTDFIIGSLAPAQTSFTLGIGSFLAKIKSLLPGQNMEFHTSEAVAAVRGTELGISKEADGQPAQVGVFDEGQVAVRHPGQTEEVRIGPGQETEVKEGASLAQAHPLRALAPQRRRFEAVRQRTVQTRKLWVPRSKQQRAAFRTKFMQKPRVRANDLKNVRTDRRLRKYPDSRRNRPRPVLHPGHPSNPRNGGERMNRKFNGSLRRPGGRNPVKAPGNAPQPPKRPNRRKGEPGGRRPQGRHQ